jgi:glycine cleavage system H protein
MPVIYTKEHEWIAVEGDIATVGISNYAQEQLGDVVFVEVPDAGRDLALGEEVAVVESVKAASEIYAPLTGEVTESNPILEEEPATINASAEGDGWIFKMTIADPSELDEMMDVAAYADYVASLE